MSTTQLSLCAGSRSLFSSLHEPATTPPAIVEKIKNVEVLIKISNAQHVDQERVLATILHALVTMRIEAEPEPAVADAEERDTGAVIGSSADEEPLLGIVEQVDQEEGGRSGGGGEVVEVIDSVPDAEEERIRTDLGKALQRAERQ